MIKYIGIALLSSCVALYGNMKSQQVKEAMSIRNSIIKLLHTIQSSIQYGGTVKSRIYYQFHDENLEKCGLLPLLKSAHPDEFSIEKSLSLLEKEERCMLTGFFTQLGKSVSCKNEAEVCRRFINEFECAGEEFEKSRKAKTMLYKKLGIICALVTAVIFI